MLPILIVEDDPTLRGVLFDLFSEDFTCHATKSVEEALDRLAAEPYSIVLTDISMPGMSGLELLGVIKQRWQDTPVIAFSGIDDEEYAQGLLKIGAFDYLSKPFRLDAIAGSVARALAAHPPQSSGPPANKGSRGETPVCEERDAADNTPIFASVQLGDIISFADLLEIVQRGKMSGYIELHWDGATVSGARESGKFNDAATGSLDEAVLNCAGWLYLKEGLIADAVIDESEGSPYFRGAEESLALLVKLTIYVGTGVRAWGFSTGDVGRPERLSVRDNGAKFLQIITSDETEDVASDVAGEPCAPIAHLACQPAIGRAASGLA